MRIVARLVPYVTVGVFATVVLGLTYGKVPFTQAGAYGDGGGDAAWFLGQFASIARTGPFATDIHLNWPLGANTWAFPQAGIFVLISGWLFALVAGVSALGAYQLTFMTAIVVNSLATLFFLRSINRQRFRQLSVVLAIVVGMSPFDLFKMVHLNVAAFFLMPVALGVILRWPSATSRRSRISLLTIVAVAAVISPLWWGAVALIMLVASVPWMLALKSNHCRGIWWKPTVALGLGLAVPTILGLVFAVPGSAKTRFPWDSNRFGGHFVDLLTSSPYLNGKLPFLTALLEGGSEEKSLVGVVGGALGILTVVLVLTAVARRNLRQRARVLLGLSVITAFSFVLGGLGNLQAAVGVVVGEASPARVWARLIIVMALLGGAWVMHWLTSRPPVLPNLSPLLRRFFYEGMLLVLVVLWSLDFATATPRMVAFTPASALTEAGAVDYLSGALNPCPVAQLPVDSSPNEALFIAEFGEVGYRGYIPFVLAPDFYWSYGGDATADSTVPTAEVGPEVTDATLSSLSGHGYCAVLFDKRMSELAIQNGVELPGTSLNVATTPDYSDNRYDVFVVNRNAAK